MIFEVIIESDTESKTCYMYGFQLRSLISKVEEKDEFYIDDTRWVPSQVQLVEARKICLSEVKKIDE